MPRRLEIELTSRTGDGGFTWRAAGARQPRGILDAGLVPSGATVGDVLRAEVESGLDGLDVVAVAPRSVKADDEATTRIEILGAPRHGPDVLVTYAPGTRRRREEGPRPGAGRGEGGRREAGSRRPGHTRTEQGGAPGGAEDRGRGRPERGPRPRRTEGPDRTARARPEGPDRRARPEGQDRRPARDRRPAVPTAHRNAMLASLGPQELPVAEQLLRGGIPAVRQALDEQAAQRPGGAPTGANREAVLAIAEQLLPRVNLAAWKDRASAAQSAGKEFRLRELRAVVTSSRAVTLDDEARAMARALREALDQRVQALHDEWVARMRRALEEGRVADALAVSSRPPEPGTRLPAELAVALADASGAAMTADMDPGEWRALLDAVVASAVRRTVKPRGIPQDPEAHDAARRAAGSVPELAKLLGLRIPPPPPRRPAAPDPRVTARGGAVRAAGR